MNAVRASVPRNMMVVVITTPVIPIIMPPMMASPSFSIIPKDMITIPMLGMVFENGIGIAMDMELNNTNTPIMRSIKGRVIKSSLGLERYSNRFIKGNAILVTLMTLPEPTDFLRIN